MTAKNTTRARELYRHLLEATDNQKDGLDTFLKVLKLDLDSLKSIHKNMCACEAVEVRAYRKAVSGMLFDLQTLLATAGNVVGDGWFEIDKLEQYE
jgi:hypothetical protein